MILLCLAETIFVSMYFIKDTRDIIKKILDFPDNVFSILICHGVVLYFHRREFLVSALFLYYP